MIIINPWKNDQLFDFLLEIYAYAIFFMALSLLVVIIFFSKKIKARNLNKILIIILIIMSSFFAILFYWYISVFLCVLFLLLIFHVQKMEAIKTYKNEMKGIYDFRINSTKGKNIIKVYDNVIPKNMDLSKYVIPKYRLMILNIVLIIFWISLICLFGYNYYFF